MVSADAIDAFVNAFKTNSKWKAYIPVTTTHFMYAAAKDNTIIPNNNTGESTTINLLDMLHTNVVTNPLIQCYYKQLAYSSTAGLQLQAFNGDSDEVVSTVCSFIKQSALQHSTVLKSTIRLDKRE